MRGPVAVQLQDIDVTRLAQVPKRWPREMVPRDVEYEATATGHDGTRVHLKGAILDQWIDIFGGEHRVALDVDKAGAIARMMSGGSLAAMIST